MFVSTHSPDFLNAVKLNEVFCLVKEDGHSEIRCARDDQQIAQFMSDGDQMGRLWKQGFFGGYKQMKYIDVLRNTESFRKRNEDSLIKINEIRKEFEEVFKSKNIVKNWRYLFFVEAR